MEWSKYQLPKMNLEDVIKLTEGDLSKVGEITQSESSSNYLRNLVKSAQS